ncbi:hypothetical protein ACFYWU_38335 [Streptomyces chrestomyceticus]|uniref:hypothetical protein n=1 Tax=Streptomyces chrestomyceticus TaxID=68185 RepID=UPI0036A0BAD4
MITHWWLNEMPPIPGVLRAVFYAGLLVICLVDRPSPLATAQVVGTTQPAFYTPVGVLRLLGVKQVGPGLLTFVTRLTVVVWVAAAAGLLQPATGALTFLGFAFLHAVNAGALGANHSTHSALYALLCMSFSVSYDFSLDGLLAQHTAWPLLVPENSVLTSGFAPALLLVCLAYTMFAGGVAKVRYGWSGWRDGTALRFYLEQSAPVARWPWLSRLMLDSPVLCRLAAWGTLVIELGAIVAVFSSEARMPLILSWVCLHIGILCMMMPAYWVQMWCYLLLLDWPWLTSLVTGEEPARPVFPDSGAGAVVLTAVGCLVVAALVYVLLFESEQWPFTSVPMYSNGTRGADRIVLPRRSELHARALRAARGRHRAWQRAWVDQEYMEDIWVRPADDGAEPQRLFHLMHERGAVPPARWSQYAKVVRETAVEDIVAKPADRPEHTEEQEYPAARFLREVVPLVRNALPGWEQYRSLELICRTECGGVVIARAELADRTAGEPVR